MAIQFARIELVGRATGGNACRKSSYNARDVIKDINTNVTYDFSARGDNVYHEILLPKHVNKKFQNISLFMNEVERSETRKNSSLLKDIVIALPDDKELDLQDRVNISHRVIDKMEWVKEGLGVQLDIHEPHDGEKNWHAHILLPKRRFTECGAKLGKKARDLDIQIRGGKNPFGLSEEQMIHEKARDVINNYFKEMGLENRVDAISINSQEHVGAVRMRSIFNQAAQRNEERKEANIEHLSSGARVLDSITRHISVFNKKDLERAVKIVPDSELRSKLVEDALASKTLISLYNHSGKNTGYFTTTKIREEEEKLLRLSGYVANSKNCIFLGGNKSLETANRLVDKVRQSLTEERQEQYQALSHLLLDNSGIRILRGRAGTGKSYVLGHVQRIANATGVNVIGLAPTHKARMELAQNGYEQNDVVKGMLFKLNHGRFDLPKNSLLVVDEAGMIGNDDFTELLRVAATRKCNVILSGDEKQLTSVQRGGMFEVFADRYGSTSMLNIQRQDSNWGKSVAMAFSNGEVSSGVSILQEQSRITENANQNDSMQTLLNDWNQSKECVVDRLIIAVKNSDVDALNHGARQYLKVSGDLRGEEIAVAGSHYMQGDRILIKQTNKELGLINGDFATIVHASTERFVVSLENAANKNAIINDNSKLVEFKPTAYNGFKHGYATTVFKAQGASIKDVYVFHNGFAGIRNSYVALSRNIKDLHLYTNKQATKTIAHLVKQLGHDPEIGSSLSYLTKQEFEDQELDATFAKSKNILAKFAVGALNIATKAIDKYLPDTEYYNYKAPEFKKEKVEAVLDVVGEELNQGSVGSEVTIEERAVVGGNNHSIVLDKSVSTNNVTTIASSLSANSTANTPQIPNKRKQTAKERFYANADRTRGKVSHLQQKAQWDKESEILRSEVNLKSEAVARALLGEPNKVLSDGRTLRFGENGKLAVRISGERMGSWYDFASEKGGDMFTLVQDKQGLSFKQAADYLRQSVGIEAGNNNHLQLVHDHRNSDVTANYIRAKAETERIAKHKEEQASKLYSRSKEIGQKSVAYQYLTQHRAIDCNIGIAEDIKTTGIYVSSEQEQNKGRYLPAIIAFARDSDGNITGGQQLVLNKSTAAKASIAVPRKSFGKISGSFVNVGNITNAHNQQRSNNTANCHVDKITIIAEGLETAMSVRQGLSEHNEKHRRIKTQILCSLGINNIKNYQPSKDEKIIIAADNDGINSITNKTIESAKETLEAKGAFVEIASPDKQGDFNDLLKSSGTNAIKESFEPALAKHTARTIEDYLAVATRGGWQDQALSKDDKLNLSYIEKYNLPQEAVINAFRTDKDIGIAELSKTKEYAESVSKDMDFLVNQNIKTKEQLLEDIKDTKDIKLTAEDLRKQCKQHANLKVSMAHMSVSVSDNNGQEDLSLQEMLKIQACIKDISPYLSAVETTRVEHFEDRLQVYDIYKQHKEQNPVEAQRFKDEMQSLNRFTTSGNTKDALKYHEEQDITAATKFAQHQNYNSVIFKLSRRFNIAKSDKSLSGKDYIDVVAKDSQIMRYVDIAIANGNKFTSPEPKDNNLLDYANQRDAFNIVETIKSPNDIYLFKSNIEDMQKYSNREDLKLAIEIYKNQGLKNFNKKTDIMCGTAIDAKIKSDICSIGKGKLTKGFDQKDYTDKAKYLCAISSDQNLMRYINPKSDIGKEIEEHKQMSNSFGLER